MLRSLVIALVLAVSPPLHAAAQEQAPAAAERPKVDAPFGLSWGTSWEEVTKLGVQLEGRQSGKYGVEASARRLPKALADLDTVFLFFGHDDRLWRVVAASDRFENDPYGGRVQNRYRELVEALNARYGKGKRMSVTPSSSFMAKAENYVYSVHQGERFETTEWKSNGVSVELSIRAPQMGEARWVVIYESLELAREFEKANKAREKDAL